MAFVKNMKFNNWHLTLINDLIRQFWETQTRYSYSAQNSAPETPICFLKNASCRHIFGKSSQSIAFWLHSFFPETQTTPWKIPNSDTISFSLMDLALDAYILTVYNFISYHELLQKKANQYFTCQKRADSFMNNRNRLEEKRDLLISWRNSASTGVDLLQVCP